MKPILLITEGYDSSEARFNKPLAGIYNALTDWLLIQAGLSRRNIKVISIFNQEIKRSKDGKTIMDRRGLPLWGYSKGYTSEGYDAKRSFDANYSNWLNHASNDIIIVPMGELSLRQVTGKSGIRKYRGSPLIGKQGQLCIPTLQPYQVSERGEYLLRYAVASDFKKAKRYAEGYEAPTRELILPRNRTEELEGVV